MQRIVSYWNVYSDYTFTARLGWLGFPTKEQAEAVGATRSDYITTVELPVSHLPTKHVARHVVA